MCLLLENYSNISKERAKVLTGVSDTTAKIVNSVQGNNLYKSGIWHHRVNAWLSEGPIFQKKDLCWVGKLVVPKYQSTDHNVFISGA